MVTSARALHFDLPMSPVNPYSVAGEGHTKRRCTMDWLVADAANSAGIALVDSSWFGGETALVLAFAVLLAVFAAVAFYVVAVDRSE
jgi:hypothetical protein